MEHTRKARQRIGILQKLGIDPHRVASSKVPPICRSFIYPLADYAALLSPPSYLDARSLAMDAEVIRFVICSFSDARSRLRLVNLGKFQWWEQCNGLRVPHSSDAQPRAAQDKLWYLPTAPLCTVKGRG